MKTKLPFCRIISNVSEDDSKEETVDDDIVPENEDYFFPTPDEVKEAKAPYVGMTFRLLDVAQQFVNVYGQLVGFSVIKGKNYKHSYVLLQCKVRASCRGQPSD